MMSNIFYGKVSDNKDPDELNRVRVTILGEKEAVSDWLPVIAPGAGPDTGVSMLPDIDDQVLIVSMDEHNIRKAVVGGSWFIDGAPPVTGENSDGDLNQDGKNNLKFVKSRSGHMIIFDDTEGAEKVQLISGDGKTRFEYDVASETGNLTTELDIMIGAKGSVTIKGESVKILSDKAVEINGEEYKVSAKKEINITADKDVSIKGSGIALN